MDYGASFENWRGRKAPVGSNPTLSSIFMHQSYFDEKYVFTNRDKVKSPRRGRSYCDHCDRSAPADDTKCPICNMRQGWPRKRRFKK